MAEWMAVAVGQRSLACCSQVGKYEGRGGFGRQPFQIDAVPGWNGGGEDARFGAEGGRCVVANAETVAIMRPSGVLERRSEHFYRKSAADLECKWNRTRRRRQSYDWVRIECWG